MGVALQNAVTKPIKTAYTPVFFSSGQKGGYGMAPKKISRILHSCRGQKETKICVHIAKVWQCLQDCLGFGCGFSKSRELARSQNASGHSKREFPPGATPTVHPFISILGARCICARFCEGLHLHTFAKKPGLH